MARLLSVNILLVILSGMAVSAFTLTIYPEDDSAVGYDFDFQQMSAIADIYAKEHEEGETSPYFFFATAIKGMGNENLNEFSCATVPNDDYDTQVPLVESQGYCVKTDAALFRIFVSSLDEETKMVNIAWIVDTGTSVEAVAATDAEKIQEPVPADVEGIGDDAEGNPDEDSSALSKIKKDVRKNPGISIIALVLVLIALLLIFAKRSTNPA